MKRIIRLRESQLNGLIKKAIKEQEEDQFMSAVDQDKMSGGVDDTENTDEPNYEAFMSAAKGLLESGVTIGNLVDKLLDAQNTESEEVPAEEPEVEEPQLNENKRKPKK